MKKTTHTTTTTTTKVEIGYEPEDVEELLREHFLAAHPECAEWKIDVFVWCREDTLDGALVGATSVTTTENGDDPDGEEEMGS